MRPIYFAATIAVACASCVPQPLRSTTAGKPTRHEAAELWERPANLRQRNLFDGPWGKALAPDPGASYAYVSTKTSGGSPGFLVTDPHGMEWNVKQGPEARVEVVMSRILWAVGYHQPPVYYLPKWTLGGGPAAGLQSEARFRPKHSVLNDTGEWSWQANPFIGTQPYNGLRVLLMVLNASDMKNNNNSLYELTGPADAGSAAERWYVVRDIGTALGETGRVGPRRNDPALFEREAFIKRVGRDGFVDFNYRGRQHELSVGLTPADVRWMCELLGQLSPAQWHDAFRAAGYDLPTANRFIARIGEKIAAGRALAP